MTAPVPFIGFYGFTSPGEVTNLLDPYTLACANNVNYDHRKILIGVEVGNLGFTLAREILAQAPGSHCIRILAMSSVDIGAGILTREQDATTDGLMDLSTEHRFKESRYLDVFQAQPRRRLLMPVTKDLAGACGWNPRTLMDHLQGFARFVTDFVFDADDFPEDVFDTYVEALYARFSATHGVVLRGTYDLPAIRQKLKPLWAADRHPRMSLMMTLPPDPVSQDVRLRRCHVLREAFGMTSVPH